MLWNKVKNSFRKLTPNGRAKLVQFFRENVSGNVALALNSLNCNDIEFEEMYLDKAVSYCELANKALGNLPIHNPCKNKYEYMLLEEIGISEFKNIIEKFEQVISILERKTPDNYERKDTIELISVLLVVYHRIVADFEKMS